MTVIPESDFLSGIQSNARSMMIGVVAMLILLGGVTFFLAKFFVAAPIKRIADQLGLLRNFELEKGGYQASLIFEIDHLSRALDDLRNNMIAFSKYIPTELVRTLVAQRGIPRLGGENKEITILISKILEFDTIARKMAADHADHMGEYLWELTDQIVKHRGTMDKFMGDRFRAFWGAPHLDEQHALNACRAALRCQALLHSLSIRWAHEGKPPLTSRIAINTGSTFVGNLGHEEWMDYTVAGEPVYHAARLLDVADYFQVPIIIGERVALNIGPKIIMRRLGFVGIKKQQEGQNAYELLDIAGEVAHPDQYRWVESFDAALTLFEKGQWNQAHALFEEALLNRGMDDRPAMLYMAACQKKRMMAESTDSASSVTP
jgi:adenylate cyclase